LEIGMNPFASQPPHRLICQLLWRERLRVQQPGWRETILRPVRREAVR
jgi:hypothetical protein